MRQPHVVGAVFEHFHETRFVQRRIGVRRAGQRGHAPGHGSLHFGFERSLVLVARFTQAGGKIHQAGREDLSAAIDGARWPKAMRRGADADDFLVRYVQVAFLVEPIPRVHQPGTGDGKRGVVPVASHADGALALPSCLLMLRHDAAPVFRWHFAVHQNIHPSFLFHGDVTHMAAGGAVRRTRRMFITSRRPIHSSGVPAVLNRRPACSSRPCARQYRR